MRLGLIAAVVLLPTIGAVLGVFIIGPVAADMDADTEIRLVARNLEDGRVEIGLQQRGADGRWNERTLPEQRFLSPRIPADDWRTSEPIRLVSDGVAYEPQSFLTHVIESVPQGTESWPEHWFVPRERQLYCVAHHGPVEYGPDALTDSFWNAVNSRLVSTAARQGWRVRIIGSPDPAEQAAGIRQCIEDGAAGVATTLADPEVIRSAIEDLKNAGIPVVTFNSGADAAIKVGSGVHIAINEIEAGRQAGHAFNKEGAKGTILCVIHERLNVGLSDRCEGLSQTAEQSVENLQLEPAGDATAAIAARLKRGDVGGVLTLNRDTLRSSIAARDETGSTAVLGTVGADVGLLATVAQGAISFYIFDFPDVQGTSILAALVLLPDSTLGRSYQMVIQTQAVRPAEAAVIWEELKAELSPQQLAAICRRVDC